MTAIVLRIGCGIGKSERSAGRLDISRFREIVRDLGKTARVARGDSLNDRILSSRIELPMSLYPTSGDTVLTKVASACGSGCP